MPDDLGESVLDLLLSNVRGAEKREASQEKHRTELVSTWSGFVIPHQEPVQVIESRVLQSHRVETCIIWRPIRKGVARAYSAMLGIVKSDFHSSPSLRL